MDKSKQRLAGSKTTSKWADQVQVTENSKHQGVELLFNNEPSHELQSKLRAMGFRPSKVKNMWYSDNNASTKAFALDVQSTISSSVTGPDLFLSPSFEASRTNIEKKDFSFILITLKDGQIKNYIVFEPSKPKAEVIATQFSRQHFGDDFLALAAKPRTQLREARILFNEGKIIFPSGQQAMEERSVKAIPPVSIKSNTESIETAADKMRELEHTTLQKFYKWAAGKPEYKDKTNQASRNLFNDWLKENAPEVSQTSIENMWARHLRVVKAVIRIQNQGNGIQPYSSIYKKLLQVIPDVIKHIDAGMHTGKSIKDSKGGLMDLHFDYLGKDKNGNYLISLSHYFKQNGDMVADPDMQIRILPQMEAAEAMTYQDQFAYQEVYPDKGDGKSYVDLRRKKELNRFLNQWLTNIIRQGHTIDLTQSESEVKSSGEDPDQYFHLAYDQLLQLIPGLLTHLKDGIQKGELNDDTDETERKIEVRLTPNPDHGSHTLLINESLDGKETLRSELTIVPADKQAYVTAEWLSWAYADRYDREESEDEIDERDGDIGEEMTRGFTEWLDDIFELGHQIKLTPSINETESSEGYLEYFKNYSIPSIRFPEEEVTIEQFHEQGFTSPFSAQEAFDKNLPVIDLAFRYTKPMEHFKDKIEIPLQKQIKELQQELKNSGNTKDQRNALKDKITNLETEIRVAERLVQDESLIFQGDLFKIILEKARQKGYSVANDLISFREYMLENIFDNRAIENYHREPIQKVVGELLDEYFDSKKAIPAIKAEPIQPSTDPSWEVNLEAHKDIRNSLANKHGVYTEETAGDSYERITIPIPKAAQYEAEIRIVRDMDGTFATGIWASKKFGDYSGMSYGPSMTDTHYRTRAEALTAALHVHLLRLEQLKNAKDSTLNNEEKKNKQLTTALNALRDFAKANDLSLDKKDGPLTNKHHVYTEETAGDNFEHLVIPMPKGALYKAEIDLVKQSDGSYVKGITLSKNFGDRTYKNYSPSSKDVSFNSRAEALSASLKEHARQLQLLIDTPDGILNNEEKKKQQLTAALNALWDFANANNIALDKKDTTVISSLKADIAKQPSTKIKKQNQHELNKEIEALIDRKDQEKSFFSEEEKVMLRQYSGSGGLIKQGATGKGILYEYYTPDIIIKKMWDLAYHFGYDGGSVLEPSVGTGNFLKYAPKGSVMVGYEVNHYAARIAQILYPAAQIHEAAFETIFFAGNVHLKDEYADTRYSLVIGNPPYGEFLGRYAGMGEKKWTRAFQYELYFTLRGLDLLKSDGLLIYIVPSNFPHSYADAIKIAAKSTGLDRYYLGTGIFKTTDIETGIIVLRKN